MVLDPNANWTAALDDETLSPVYYLAIDGLTSKHYSTAPVRSAGTTKTVLLNIPRGVGGSVDLVDGRYTLGRVTVELLDVDDEITDLVSVKAPGAPLSALKNRKVTLYGGYRHLSESDYAVIGTYRITGIKANKTLTGYELELSDPLYLIDAPIMENATETAPSTIRGNVVNLAVSILRGVFSTSDPDFPLDYVSTAGGSSSVPTGIGIPDALLDFTQIKAERDAWRYDDVGEIVFVEPETGKDHLEAEFFRAFQARPIVTGEGLIGIKFNVPALPASAAPTVELDDIVAVRTWRLLLDDHLNKFTIRGDYDEEADSFSDLYATETTEDTTDQAATDEVVEYLVESRWIRTEYEGVEIAAELAGRMRLTYLDIPALLEVDLLFRKRNLEPGDIVAVTHPTIPDLRTGTRGITSRLMIVLRLDGQFEKGLIRVSLLDLGYRRYGVIAPSSKTGDYATASDADRNTFFFICNSSNAMSTGDDGFRLI